MASVPSPDPAVADREALRAALRAGLLLGWTSVVGIAVVLVFGPEVRSPTAVAVLTGVGALAHTFLATLDWPQLLRTRRGRLLLDAWGAGVLVAVCALAIFAGGQSRLDLLLLLVVPFLAITHQERPGQLAGWLVAAGAAFLAAVLAPDDRLETGEVLLHLVLLVGATLLGLSLTRALERQALGRAEAARRAALEGALLAEAHHRVKNSLQVVSDLLLLGRPADPTAAAVLDRAAGRIRSIAAVHRALESRAGAPVAAPELVTALVEAIAPDVPVRVHVAEQLTLSADRAQSLGVVVNELLTNALEHGSPPFALELVPHGDEIALLVQDAGDGPDVAGDDAGPADGLGLVLVRQIVGAGLNGRIETRGGAVRVTFPFRAPGT